MGFMNKPTSALDAIETFEGIATADQKLEALAYLHNGGLIPSLQGNYGRTLHHAVTAGHLKITPDGQAHVDYNTLGYTTD